MSLINVTPEPNLPCISFSLISVTKMWDTIISLYMCKGHTHHATVLDCKSGSSTTNKLNIDLPIAVKWETKTWISDEIDWQSLSQWYHTSDRRSGQCTIRISMFGNHHGALIHMINCGTIRSELVQMVEFWRIAKCTSWKWKRRSWISKGDKLRQY